MPQQTVWPVEPSVCHVAKGKQDGWKVFQEGDAAPKSRHEDRDGALEAAAAIARDAGSDKIKVHNPDGTLDRVLRPDRI